MGDLDDMELIAGIEKVAEFSSQLSRVLLTLGQGYKSLTSSVHKTEDSVIDIRESLKKTRSKLETVALLSKGRRGSSDLPEIHVGQHVTTTAVDINPNDSWQNIYESARLELRSMQNDLIGNLLETMEEMHEVNETLGIQDGESDLMQKMSIEEKLNGINRRLIVQNKMNDVIANFFQNDHISLTFHTFGQRLTWVEQQVGTFYIYICIYLHLSIFLIMLFLHSLPPFLLTYINTYYILFHFPSLFIAFNLILFFLVAR